jgi:hypothetical protein
MAVLKIPVYLLWVLIAVIAILVIAFVFIKLNNKNVSPANTIPSSVEYALEYFNAANQNSTLLVPSQYYAVANGLAANGNNVVENNKLYYSILFNGTSLPKGYYILMDMQNISALPGAIALPYNFTQKNISSSLQDCDVAGSNSAILSICNLYTNVTVPVLNSTVSKEIRLGYGTFMEFPSNSTTLELNSTIIYNGVNRTNIPSFRVNNTAFSNGSAFVYANTTAFYLSPGALKTFYGSEMFLPNSTLKNVFANFVTVRIIG